MKAIPQSLITMEPISGIEMIQSKIASRILQAICHYMPRGGGLLASRLWPLVERAGLLPRRTWLGFPMLLDFSNGDHVSYWVGRYERGTVSVLLENLKPGTLFIDVGANSGYFSLIAARQVGPSGFVIAFEPEPQIRSLLVSNVGMNHFSNIEVRAFGVADRVGEVDFVSRPHSGNSMVLPRKHVHSEEETVIRASMTTLDLDCLEIAQRWRGDVVLKMDIEGSEPAALRGAKDLLRCVFAVIVEMRPDLLRMLDFEPNDLLVPLLQAGFAGYAIPDTRGSLEPIRANHSAIGNLLFVRE